MDNEIEKLKQERDEILTKALRLIELEELADGGTAINREDWDSAVGDLRALRPKPKPREGWLEMHCGKRFEDFHFTEPSASLMGRIREQGNSIHHMREVLPAPKWERWEAGGVEVYCGTERVGFAECGASAKKIAGRINAEMERLSAMWEGGAE